MSHARTWMIMACLALCAAGAAWSAPATPTSPQTPATDSCSSPKPGDANGDNAITREDVNFLLNYLCHNGPAPDPPANGDPNGDCVIDSLDVAFLIGYVYYGGPAPDTCTCTAPAKGACFVDTCAYQSPGDVNGDGSYNVGDLVDLINFLFKGGPLPRPLANGDVNGDCVIDYGDYLCMLESPWPEWPCRHQCTCVLPVVDYPCNREINGDANGVGDLNVGDAVYIVNYVFRSGSAPVPYAIYSGDANTDCVVNVGDAVMIINHIFKGGPAPYGCFSWLESCGQPVR